MLLVIVIGLVVIAIINTNMAECSLLAIKSASAAEQSTDTEMPYAHCITLLTFTK